ncbi:permease [Formosa sediminum]|uniref:Permease n=1 Tax=Formosa sediminum TaxID=2594004 RepID=A0A516GPR9_9FLAO|nr:permease [Formosa sediminum]QDO93350.1 permease [Formosa sediminum]
MSEAHVKALSFITFILLGFLIKKKFTSKDETNGLKKIILLLALPATIFIALLQINLNTELLILPVIALVFNGFLYLITPLLLHVIGITDTATKNTAKLLLPSLAPGLSCFPFILEFLGPQYLGKAAMADLGNKFFVLFVLYIIAVSWYYKNQTSKSEPISTKLKALGKVMLLEPVNIFICIALIFVFSGIHMANLPLFIQDNLTRLSGIMTPLVLLFIGLAVVIKKKQIAQIFSLLMLKNGVTLLIIGCLITVAPIFDSKDILLILVFGLSACSFWPFAHISSIATKEIDAPTHKSTFNVDFALSILALSLPLSVLLILSIFTAGNTFTKAPNILIFGCIILSLGLIVPAFNILKKGKTLNASFSKLANTLVKNR